MPPPRSIRHKARRRRTPILVAVSVAVILAVVASVAIWMLRGESKPAEQASGPSSYAGTWNGEMTPEGDSSKEEAISGDITLKLQAEGERGTAELAASECRGSLDRSSRDGDTLVLEYVETYDPDQRCVDEGTLELDPGTSADSIEVRWSVRPSDGGSLASTGTLR